MGLGMNISKAALSTVDAVMMHCHENACTASLGRTFSSQALDLPIAIDLVVLEDGQFDCLMLVLDLLWLCVRLLLTLLSTAAEPGKCENVSTIRDTEFFESLVERLELPRGVGETKIGWRNSLNARGSGEQVGGGVYGWQHGSAARKGLEKELLGCHGGWIGSEAESCAQFGRQPREC